MSGHDELDILLFLKLPAHVSYKFTRRKVHYTERAWSEQVFANFVMSINVRYLAGSSTFLCCVSDTTMLRSNVRPHIPKLHSFGVLANASL